MAMSDPVRDRHAERECVSSDEVWAGSVFSLRNDLVRVVEGAAPVARQYMAHPGAVAIVALRGDAGAEEILLERQYRHPVSAELWEIPAGLLDIEGEDPLVAAQRELAEEADLQAGRWDVLLDYFNSPGCSDESIRLFLARDLSQLPEKFAREDEEADLVYRWVSLDEAVRAVLEGRIHNASAICGILATSAARDRGWQIRGTESPWMR